MAIIGTVVGLLGACCKFGDCGREVRLIVCPKRRAKTLHERMNLLKGYKAAIENEVGEKITEQPWLTVRPNIEVWTQSVDALSKLVDKIPQGDLPFWRRLCCCYTYALGDKIQQYLEEIDRLEKQRCDAIKDDLVIDVIPINYLKMQLENDMKNLRATKKDLEYMVSWLETAAAFPPRVRSERVKLWIGESDSLEAEAYTLK